MRVFAQLGPKAIQSLGIRWVGSLLLPGRSCTSCRDICLKKGGNMEREFIVLGPFDIPVKRYPSGRLIDSRTKAPLDSFWEDAEAVAKKKGLAGKPLRERFGCYVYAHRAGLGYTPWYVGQTKRGFGYEAFERAKLIHYNLALAQCANVRPVMFFVVQKGRGQADETAINDLETFLIRSAYQANHAIMNIQKIRYPWRIKGVVRAKRGEDSESTQAFKRTFNF